MEWDFTWVQPTDIKYPVSEPWISNKEKDYVNLALDENWIGSNGKFNDKAEDFLSNLLGIRSLSVSNGSVALMLALRALDIGHDDEVLVPQTTFAATASAVVNVGAIPVFCEVDINSWCIDLESIKSMTTSKTKAIIVVHLYGVPANISEIVFYAKSRGLFVIEDCAEAFYAINDGGVVGSFGDIATFSFFANKLITSGEGGAVSSNNSELFERMKLLRGQGMDTKRRYYFLEPGFNFRMTNIQAGILLGQLERFDEIKKQRLELENRYYQLLQDLITHQTLRKDQIRAPWLFTTRISGFSRFEKYQLASYLAQNGIETRPVFWPLSEMPAFSKFKRDNYQNAKIIADQGISLPTGSSLTSKDIDVISSQVKKGVIYAKG